MSEGKGEMGEWEGERRRGSRGWGKGGGGAAGLEVDETIATRVVTSETAPLIDGQGAREVTRL